MAEYMTFAPVSTCDRALIYSFTARYAGNSADLTMHSLFCWSETYPSFWCVVDGFLIIRIHFPEPNSIFYSVPMGSGDFSHLIPMLEDDALSLGVPLRFLGGKSETHDIIRKALPHYGRYFLRSNSDYIYSRSDLQSLKGRKYQPKRNHLNHFLANYDYTVEPFTEERTTECLQMLEEWENEHIARITAPRCQPDIHITATEQSYSSENMGPSKVNDSISDYLKELEREKVCIKRAFENWDSLGLSGIVLYAKEKTSKEREGTSTISSVSTIPTCSYKPAAFCYGSAINESTFCTHIEKALESITGSYAAINQLFAKSLPPQFTFINREDDMGHTGLRTAKESYHPSGVEHKFIMAPMTGQMQQIRSLWLECFPDNTLPDTPGNGSLDTPEGTMPDPKKNSSEEVEQFLFTRFRAENMLCHIEEGRIVSMLHIISLYNSPLIQASAINPAIGTTPHTTTDNTAATCRYAYIYAVATAKEYRKRGIAGTLIEQAIERCRREGFDFICLIPSDDHLREWYSKYGFTLSRPISFHTADEYDFGTGNSSEDMASILPLTDKAPEAKITLPE